jgi:hypothetical protein
VFSFAKQNISTPVCYALEGLFLNDRLEMYAIRRPIFLTEIKMALK